MSRRRYISTDISTDTAVNRVAMQSEFAALLYTWLIPHARDDATITGCPERLLYEVLPGRRDKTPSDIEAALELLVSEGLFDSWDRDSDLLFFNAESFYRYQTYIKPENRRDAAKNSGKQRKTPKNTASLSLSPSLSKHSSDKSDSDAFDTFWSAYPRKVGKQAAMKAWAKAAKRTPSADIIQAVKSYPFDTRDGMQFVPHPATWLNGGRWEDQIVPFLPDDDDTPTWGERAL